MTFERDDSIDDDMIAALRADARRGVPSPSRERVLRRLGLGAAALGATASVSKGAGALVASTVATPSAAPLVSTLGLGMALGLAAGVGLELIRAPAPPTPAAAQQAKPSVPPSPARGVRAPSLTPAPSATTSGTAPPAEAAEPGRRPATHVARPVVSSAVHEPSASPPSLAAQQSLLDDARRSLTQGDGESALAVIGVHRRRFPATAFVEERAALEIRALLALGRIDEARERHTAFERAFPGSLFAPSLRSLAPAATDSVTEPRTVPQE